MSVFFSYSPVMLQYIILQLRATTNNTINTTLSIQHNLYMYIQPKILFIKLNITIYCILKFYL